MLSDDRIERPGDPDGITGYQRAKLAGLCTYNDGACGRPAHDGGQLCDRHRRKVNAAQRRYANRLREARAAEGRCRTPGCGVPSDTALCPACAIKEGRVKPSVVADKVVDNDRGDPWRGDAYNTNWARYRGKGKRGAPAASETDDHDIRKALEAVERGRIGLAYAHSAEVRALGRHRQREARAAAAGILAMAGRFLLEVAERNAGISGVNSERST